MPNNRLKAKIVERGLSIGELAKGVGLHKSALYRKLNGQCPITICEAKRIIELLNLTPIEACYVFFNLDVA